MTWRTIRRGRGPRRADIEQRDRSRRRMGLGRRHGVDGVARGVCRRHWTVAARRRARRAANSLRRAAHYASRYSRVLHSQPSCVERHPTSSRLARGSRLAATATRVEIMGDFTDWTPVALARAGDSWRLERTITPGLHRLAIRIDGGDWVMPVNVPTASDELGGRVAWWRCRRTLTRKHQ